MPRAEAGGIAVWIEGCSSPCHASPLTGSVPAAHRQQTGQVQRANAKLAHRPVAPVNRVMAYS
jgi:hypothetical protein